MFFPNHLSVKRSVLSQMVSEFAGRYPRISPGAPTAPQAGFTQILFKQEPATGEKLQHSQMLSCPSTGKPP